MLVARISVPTQRTNWNTSENAVAQTETTVANVKVIVIQILIVSEISCVETVNQPNHSLQSMDA